VGGATTALSGKVYRFRIGTDTAPVDLVAPGTVAGARVVKGFALRSGALYVEYDANGPLAFDNVVDRTLNPFDIPGAISWTTTVAAPVPVVGGGTQGLTSLIMSAPNNTIWASDSTYDTVAALQSGGTVWAYTDYLAVVKPDVTGPVENFQVSIDPVNGRADQLILSFKSMGTGTGLATAYDIQVWDAAGVTPSANVVTGLVVVTNPNQPNITVGVGLAGAGTLAYLMKANTNYKYQVRATAEASGATLTSQWSAPRTLSIQSGGLIVPNVFGPQLLSPTPGATGVALNPGFAWAPQFGATKYTFKLATDAALTKTVGGTPADLTAPSFQPATPLDNDTTYFFSVNVKEPTVGPVAIGSFRTIAKPVVAPPPITIAAPPPQATFTLPPPVTIVLPAPLPPPAPITPGWIYAIIAIGAVLVIAVIVLIVRTRRVM
jgi:hypothetical protein